MKKKIKLFLGLVVIVLIIYYYPQIKDFLLPNDSMSNIEIVDSYEIDRDLISDEFASGMNTDSFKKIINKKTNYIKSTHEYESLSYDFEKSLKYSEIEEYLYNWNALDSVKLEIIGSSHDKRNIYGVEVGFGNKEIMFDGNIHATEVSGTVFLVKYINDLLNKYYDKDEEVISLLNKYKIVFIPSINPDGYEISTFGIESTNNHNLWIYKNRDSVNTDSFKFNANGVDISRNLPTQNAGLYYNDYELIKSVSLEKTGKSGTYFGGTSLGSEPETKAFMYFALKHYKKLYTYVNLHSMGRVIYAGKPNLSTEFNELCIETANLISNINDYKIVSISSEEVGEGNDGTATDFMAELAHGFSFSTYTGRLTTDSYRNSTPELLYKYPVITLETMKKYTTDINTIKSEYYDKSLEKVFSALINN